MTERSAQPSAPPPAPAARPGRTSDRQPAPTAPTPPGKAAENGSADTAVRAGFTERLQAKLASATGSTSTSREEKRSGSSGRSPRRARLRVSRVDPWSVMKTSFLLSIAFGIVTVVSVAIIWQVLSAAGVWDSINSTIQDTVGGADTKNLDVQDYVGTSRVLGFTMLVAAVDVVLLTAVATLGAFLYNMAAALLGGIEVTLAEDQ